MSWIFSYPNTTTAEHSHSYCHLLIHEGIDKLSEGWATKCACLCGRWASKKEFDEAHQCDREPQVIDDTFRSWKIEWNGFASVMCREFPITEKCSWMNCIDFCCLSDGWSAMKVPVRSDENIFRSISCTFFLRTCTIAFYDELLKIRNRLVTFKIPQIST